MPPQHHVNPQEHFDKAQRAREAIDRLAHFNVPERIARLQAEADVNDYIAWSAMTQHAGY